MSARKTVIFVVLAESALTGWGLMSVYRLLALRLQPFLPRMPNTTDGKHKDSKYRTDVHVYILFINDGDIGRDIHIYTICIGLGMEESRYIVRDR